MYMYRQHGILNIKGGRMEGGQGNNRNREGVHKKVGRERWAGKGGQGKVRRERWAGKHSENSIVTGF